MCTKSELEQTVEEHVGKTIQSVEAYRTWFKLSFTDGTSMEVSSGGSDEGSWVTVDNS